MYMLSIILVESTSGPVIPTAHFQTVRTCIPSTVFACSIALVLFWAIYSELTYTIEESCSYRTMKILPISLK